MNEAEIYRQLQQEDLFEAFRLQLKKDFGSAGADEKFSDNLSRDFDEMKTQVVAVLEPVLQDSSKLGRLLNRVDISEAQLQKYIEGHPQEFTEALALLIIKRVLQKVILRKKFSQ